MIRSNPKGTKPRAAVKALAAAKSKSTKRTIARRELKPNGRSTSAFDPSSMPSRIWSTSRTLLGRNLIVNKAFEKFAGRKSKDIIGRTDDELLPAELAAKCRKSDEKAMKSRVPIRFEEDYAGPDGALRYFETIKSAIFDDRGKVLGLVGVSRDITERKTWEERLAESEERFRSLFENATIGLYRTTPGGRIIMANPTLVRMLGYSDFKQLSVRNLKENGFEPSYSTAPVHPADREGRRDQGIGGRLEKGETVRSSSSGRAPRRFATETAGSFISKGPSRTSRNEKERSRSSKRANAASGRSSKPPGKSSS